MNGNNVPLDIDYEPVSPQQGAPASSLPETRGNLVSFPGSQNGQLPATPEGYPVTSEQLAEVVGVSRQSVRKWINRFSEVVPEPLLTQGRGYTKVAAEMVVDFASHRQKGWAIDAWLSEVARDAYAPNHVATAEAVVAEAGSQRGSALPTETALAATRVQSSLSLANATASSAEALLDEVFGAIDSARSQRQRQQQQARVKRMIAEETLAIVQEEQLREKIRAGIIARRQAAADAELQQQLSELGGGAQ